MNSPKKTWFAFPYILWIIGFTLIPLGLVLYYAFTGADGSFTLANVLAITEPVHLKSLWTSLKMAFLTTLICFILAYPLGLVLCSLNLKKSNFIIFLFILPMWMNFLLRTYAWRALLDNNGLINNFLELIGIPRQQLMYTEGAVILGLVYDFLPFMLLPLYTAFQKLNHSYIEAAEDLGASKVQVLGRVILPLTRPAIITGITMVFMPAVSTFVISGLLGGGKYVMYGELIENEFLVMNHWNIGAALAVLMMVLLVISMAITRKYDKDGVSLC